MELEGMSTSSTPAFCLLVRAPMVQPQQGASVEGRGSGWGSPRGHLSAPAAMASWGSAASACNRTGLSLGKLPH